VELNVDGSFLAEAGSGGAEMVLQDDKGDIIFSSCRFLPHCSNALEAEIIACMEGCAKIV
jgi:ribonuclease HI